MPMTGPDLALIDLGISNLGKLLAMFARIGATPVVTASPDIVSRSRVLILPGVGAFGDGMASLCDKGLVEPILAHVAERRALFGICLGMQMLAESSEEHGRHRGLGVVTGRVVRLAPATAGYRVPNMGWCDVEAKVGSRLFSGVANGTPFYFAHSFHLTGAPPDAVAGTIAYGEEEVTVAIEREAVTGCQFHPELSQDAGLDVLHAFLTRCRQEGRFA